MGISYRAYIVYPRLSPLANLKPFELDSIHNT